MNEPRTNVFVIWDLSSNDVRITLQALARRPPQGFRISYADPGKQGGDLLTETLLPQIRSADRVLVIAPQDANAISAVSFEIGLAIGFGKTVALCKIRSAILPIGHLISSVLSLPERLGTSPAGTLEDLRAVFDRDDLWHQLPAPAPALSQREVTLCAKTGEGEALWEELTATRPGWSHLRGGDGEKGLEAILGASKLLWVLTSSGNEENAMAAGIFFARSISRSRSLDTSGLQVFRSFHASPIRSLRRLERVFEDLDEFAVLLRAEEPESNGLLRIERLQIQNFKNIVNLDLDFTPASSLSGDWTCIAGINGAGKSSILQALSMVLLGEKLVAELGSERIKRMLRREGSQRLNAEITAVLRDGREQRTLFLPLSEQGLDRSRLFSHSEYSHMLALWDRLQKQILVAYGATRNISDYKDTRYSSLSPHVQRLMTLFDPLTQIANSDILMEGRRESAPVLATLKKLLAKVLQGELAANPYPDPERLCFAQGGTDVEAIELPDGFRSTLAWLADLCAAWHQTAPPEETAGSDPAKIRGIVLLDEIDLHLHPTLQRALVPRLREALPGVQFIVTTHSPLVLSSFDRAELIVLDRDSEHGIRELDRQIFAFSTNQIYEWLMGTPAQSTVIEEKLSDRRDPDLPLYLYQSEDRSEEEARATLAERKRLIEELRSTKSRA